MGPAYNGYEYIEAGIKDVIADPYLLANVTELIDAGRVLIWPDYATGAEIELLREYLFSIRKSSLEQFSPRRVGVRNEFRMHTDRPEQTIKAKFQSWSFYPWNADIFDLYDRFADLVALRNMVVKRAPQDFLFDYREGLAARLAFQFYPSGYGYMESHRDPEFDYQVAIPTLLLSEKTRDFSDGGFFIKKGNGETVMLDELIGLGGLSLFHTAMPHGVSPIDPQVEYRPLESRGRLMMIAGVNSIDPDVKRESRVA